jgi:hypothetical protein
MTNTPPIGPKKGTGFSAGSLRTNSKPAIIRAIADQKRSFAAQDRYFKVVTLAGSLSKHACLLVALVVLSSNAGCFFRKANRVAQPQPTFPAVPADQVRIVNGMPNVPLVKLGLVTVQQDSAKSSDSALSLIREQAGAKGATAVVYVSTARRSFRNDSGQRIHDRIFVYQAIHEY